MHYRPATPADAERIATLHARSWQETYRGIMPDDFLDEEVDAERWENWQDAFRINPSNRLITVAEADGQLAGFASTFTRRDPVYGALLDNLHVSAAYKGQGVGRQLMRQAAEWVQQQQPVSPFYLWVYEQNYKARRFYDSLGAINQEAIRGEYAAVLRYTWPDTQTLITACSQPVR